MGLRLWRKNWDNLEYPALNVILSVNFHEYSEFSLVLLVISFQTISVSPWISTPFATKFPGWKTSKSRGCISP